MSKKQVFGRILDLEYQSRDEAAGRAQLAESVQLYHVCGRCSHAEKAKLFTLVDLWPLLLRVVSNQTEVFDVEAILPHGRRPSVRVVSARRLLAACLARLAERPSQVKQWLLLVGFKPRWVNKVMYERWERIGSADIDLAISQTLEMHEAQTYDD